MSQHSVVAFYYLTSILMLEATKTAISKKDYQQSSTRLNVLADAPQENIEASDLLKMGVSPQIINTCGRDLLLILGNADNLTRNQRKDEINTLLETNFDPKEATSEQTGEQPETPQGKISSLLAKHCREYNEAQIKLTIDTVFAGNPTEEDISYREKLLENRETIRNNLGTLITRTTNTDGVSSSINGVSSSINGYEAIEMNTSAYKKETGYESPTNKGTAIDIGMLQSWATKNLPGFKALNSQRNKKLSILPEILGLTRDGNGVAWLGVLSADGKNTNYIGFNKNGGKLHNDYYLYNRFQRFTASKNS